MPLMPVHIAVCNLQRFGKAGYSIDIFRPAAHVPFLCAAMKKWIDLASLAHIHEPNALGPVKLVSRTGHAANFQLLKIVPVMPDSLHSIGMEKGAVPVTHLS